MLPGSTREGGGSYYGSGGGGTPSYRPRPAVSSSVGYQSPYIQPLRAYGDLYASPYALYSAGTEPPRDQLTAIALAVKRARGGQPINRPTTHPMLAGDLADVPIAKAGLGAGSMMSGVGSGMGAMGGLARARSMGMGQGVGFGNAYEDFVKRLLQARMGASQSGL